MSLKQACEELLKIADDIEKEAQEVTMFVCEKCNHTASLASINEKRKKAAEGMENVTVTALTVNDKIICPACQGTMSYKASEESEAYYFDPDKKAKEEEKEEEEEEKNEKEASKSEPIDYDSLVRYMS